MSVYSSLLTELKLTQLIAVSKTKPIEAIQEIYIQGQRDFGENKVQELVGKYEALPKDIRWHLIGHLQSNKVKYIAPFIHCIHSVDSLNLVFEINKEAKKNNRTIQILLQLHIAKEETKFGLNYKEAIEILEYYTASNSELKNVSIIGLMGMATNTDSETIIREEFKQLKGLFNSIQKSYLLHDNAFTQLSMGMSSDYKIAIEEGSTQVRIGSTLFGER
jgi:PLP dependent protein